MTAAGLVAAALLLRNYRDLLFFYDEWDFIQGRRDWDPDTFLRAHNEHLVLVSTVVYKLLFVTAGITSYWPYAIFLTLTHLAAAGMLFAVIRAWSGNELALLAATVMLFLGTGWEVMLWPFEMGVTISLAAALGAVLCIERRTPRGDAWACVLMVLSVSAASLGLPFLVGLGIMILGASGPGRLWVVGVPGALWGAWFLAYGNSTSKVENIPQIPTYVVDSAAAALGAVAGVSPEIGRSLAVATAIAVVAGLLLRRIDRDRATAVLATAGVMWALICLSRFGFAVPATPRYVYPGAALMLLLVAVLLGRRAGATPRARAVGLVVLAFSLMANIGALRAGSAQWRDYSGQVAAGLGAMTQVRDAVPPDFVPAPVYAPQIRAAPYFEAADDLGSPAWSDAEIRAGALNAKLSADDALRRAGAITMVGAPPVPAGDVLPEVVAVADGAIRPGPGPGCVTGTPLPEASITVEVAVPVEGLQVRSLGGPDAASVGVRVARYAGITPGDPMASAPRDRTTLLVTTALTGRDEWRLAAYSQGPVVICRAVRG